MFMSDRRERYLDWAIVEIRADRPSLVIVMMMMIIMDYDDDGGQGDLGPWDDGRFIDWPSVMALNQFRQNFGWGPNCTIGGNCPSWSGEQWEIWCGKSVAIPRNIGTAVRWQNCLILSSIVGPIQRAGEKASAEYQSKCCHRQACGLVQCWETIYTIVFKSLPSDHIVEGWNQTMGSWEEFQIRGASQMVSPPSWLTFFCNNLIQLMDY